MYRLTLHVRWVSLSKGIASHPGMEGKGEGEVGWGDMFPVTSFWYRSTTLVCTGHRKDPGPEKPSGLFSLFISMVHTGLITYYSRIFPGLLTTFKESVYTGTT